MDNLISMGSIAIISYLIGAIPFGVLVGRKRGVDPRTGGSKNIGATNVARLMGWKTGLFVLILDAAKGAFVAYFALRMGLNESLIAGFSAIFGHCYSIWLKGAGGKGVATALGVLAVLEPRTAILALFVWIASAAFFRIAALSSLLAAATVVIVCSLNEVAFETQLFSLALFMLLTVRHTKNLRHLKQRWAPKKK